MSNEAESVENIEAMREAAFSHPGFRIHQIMRQLHEPYELVLWPNGRELQEHFSTFPFDRDSHYLFDIRNDELLEQYLREITRLVHNLVASVGSTIEYSRIAINDAFPDPTSVIRVANAVSAQLFEEDPELLFFQDLRNYTLHRALPPLLATVQLGEYVGSEHAINLKVSTLLEWRRWDPRVKSFLREQESIELQPTALKYVDAATVMLKKLHEVILNEHSNVLREFDVLASKHNKIVGTIREQWFSQFQETEES